MTTSTREHPSTERARPRPAGGGTTGAGALLRFLLRRERRALPCWLYGIVFLFGYQSLGSQKLYDTPQDLADLRRTMGDNTAVIAMSGPPRLLETIGGEVLFEILTYVAIVVALMNMFLVGRNTRTEEETGRAELIRSARVGRRAPVVAALYLALTANVITGVLLFVTGVATGLPAGGSLLVGAAMTAYGLLFAALTAAVVQVFEGVRAAYGVVTAVLGAAYVLRAIGDVGNGALSWASPIGWAQRTFPYSENRWWPLLFPLLAAAVLTVAAFALLERRDFAAGLLPPRPGRAAASPSLGTPTGLAWRLQRWTLVAWAAGVLLMGLAFGSMVDSTEEFVADNPKVADVLGGGANLIDSFLALAFVINALLAAAFGVVSTLRLRAEETSGRAEPILATGVSRSSWLSGHLTVPLGGTAVMMVATGFGTGIGYALAVSDAGQIPRMTVMALAYLPAVWLFVGLAALCLGWAPRLAAVVAWALVGYSTFIAMFADAIDLPDWTGKISPLEDAPQLPSDDFSAVPVLALTAVAAALLAGGYLGLRRRDVGP
ncbi:ABC transporter permease [Actinomadura fibrosa]|uniref:ABC transporter permease n=1 Tax=Actinomadura fibrosa TaxID=111802 RepID=A0ABW2XXB5_9ACTN|nr:ABC transporter permease [Actinomadura fibrosa]